MSNFSKADTVRILVTSDKLSAGHIPARRRAWIHLIALGLIQKGIARPREAHPRARAGGQGTHDHVYGALASGVQS